MESAGSGLPSGLVHSKPLRITGDANARPSRSVLRRAPADVLTAKCQSQPISQPSDQVWRRPRGTGGHFFGCSIEMLVGLLGILKASGAYVPLDPAYPRDRLTLMRENSQLKLLLSEKRLPGESPAAASASQITGWHQGHVTALFTKSRRQNVRGNLIPRRQRRSNPPILMVRIRAESWDRQTVVCTSLLRAGTSPVLLLPGCPVVGNRS
jgi:acyl-CoA synthetase (AMP-forming)/AMP-acid ligase II